jgi:ParB family transcriptional regulator, chromosome partitioning protein
MKTPGSGNAFDPKRRALGRGLESLLPSRPAPAIQAVAEEPTGQPLEIPLGKIDANPFQPRNHFDPDKLMELAESIKATGVVQPITVRPMPNGRYQLIAGERRLRASEQAGKPTIPAVVKVVSDEQAMEMTIVENLQRADLNAMEQARGFQHLSKDFNMTQEQIALRTGTNRATIGNFLRLLRLPEPVQYRVELGELSFGHAKAILSLPTHEAMIAAATKIVALSFSVRQAETYIHGLLNPDVKATKLEKAQADEAALDPNVHEAQLRLQQRLGLRVKIEDKSGKGKVVIEYASLEDFDLLMGALGGE